MTEREVPLIDQPAAVAGDSLPFHQVTPEAVVNERVVQKGEVPKLLPVQEAKDGIIAGIRAHDTFLLEGKTGSGKSSFGPGYLLEALQQDDPHARVIVTQPRRIAVEETYKRAKGIVGEEHVAFRHGKGKAGPENAKITIMPDASLTNEMQRNPTLRGISAVMVDEAHEEGPDMIVNMGLLKKIQRERAGTDHPLKVVYTTATFDKDKHKAFNPDAGEIEVPGRAFPVEQRYIDNPHFISDDPKEAEEINKRIFEGIIRDEKGGISLRDMPIVAARVTNEVLRYRKDGGDPVVILPGRAEIAAAVKEFERINPQQEYAVLLGGQQDAAAFKKIHHEEGKRIAFFASEVVEASVTIDKATDVIDGGYSRKPYFDPQTGLSTLRTVVEAKANNRQRIGRAGRTRPGWSITLVPKTVMEQQPEHLESQLQRADLTGMILKLKAHGFQNIHDFDFVDTPDTDTINVALERLYQLGAIDSDGNITEAIGKEMARIPLEPHLARMLVEAKQQGCVEEMEVAMGFLSSTKNVFKRLEKGEKFAEKYRQFVVEGSDILTLLSVWNAFVEEEKKSGGDRSKLAEWAQNNHIQLEGLYDARTIKDELSGKREEEGVDEDERAKKESIVDLEGKKDAIVQCLTAGLSDRLLFKTGPTYRLANGKKTDIVLSNTSVVVNPEFVVSATIRSDEKTGRTYASLNQVVPKEAFEKALERIRSTPSGILLDKKEEAEVKQVGEAVEEMVRDKEVQESIAREKETVQEDEKSVAETPKEKAVEDSFFHKITTPMRWVREDVQALVGGIWQSIKWLLGKK